MEGRTLTVVAESIVDQVGIAAVAGTVVAVRPMHCQAVAVAVSMLAAEPRVESSQLRSVAPRAVAAIVAAVIADEAAAAASSEIAAQWLAAWRLRYIQAGTVAWKVELAPGPILGSGVESALLHR